MRERKPFYRVFTEGGPLVVLAVAFSSTGLAGEASAAVRKAACSTSPITIR